MDHYIDIQLKPNTDSRINILFNKVFTNFHKALFDMKASDIGVSFPNYKVLLGDIIRIHSTQERLQQLSASNWLGDFACFCSVTSVQKVPESVNYRIISRKQQNMTNAKLKRLMQRGSITEKEIKQYKVKMYSQGLSEAYIELESTSNGHKHRRYILFGELQPEPSQGKFDYFGLSQSATIPWF